MRGGEAPHQLSNEAISRASRPPGTENLPPTNQALPRITISLHLLDGPRAGSASRRLVGETGALHLVADGFQYRRRQPHRTETSARLFGDLLEYDRRGAPGRLFRQWHPNYDSKRGPALSNSRHR